MNAREKNEYEQKHNKCEVFAHIPAYYRHECKIMGYTTPASTEFHHIAKAGVRRDDHITNIIRVCNSVHMDFLERYTIAGRVLCQWIKWKKGELDVEVMNDIMLGCFPTILETDNHREKCSVWPFIEHMRRELVEALCDAD